MPGERAVADSIVGTMLRAQNDCGLDFDCYITVLIDWVDEGGSTRARGAAAAARAREAVRQARVAAFGGAAQRIAEYAWTPHRSGR
jgi:hypothetical protein